MNDRNFILGKLAKLEKLKLGKFYFGSTGRKAPPGATFQTVPRFNFVLAGAKRVSLPLAGVQTELYMGTGDVQVSDRNSWELITQYVSPCEILCLVPRNDYLRVSHYGVSTGKDGKQIVKNTFYHTSHRYSEALRHAANALCASSEVANSAAVCHQAKALIGLVIEECSAVQDDGQGRAEALFNRIIRWMENHFTEDISRDTVAKTFTITPSYVSMLFKKVAGGTFIDLLTSQRIEFAKILLEESDMTVYQVAEKCGYRNYVYFVRRFRELCGMPPGLYKNSHYRKE